MQLHLQSNYNSARIDLLKLCLANSNLCSDLGLKKSVAV